mmetsp:Transcript_61180/g.170807  ORF Transcript_61180/g.170807 Transcript_61180/m.170807 type:complete len:412 (-) Transcript_61180:18-1253(-)
MEGANGLLVDLHVGRQHHIDDPRAQRARGWAGQVVLKQVDAPVPHRPERGGRVIVLEDRPVVVPQGQVIPCLDHEIVVHCRVPYVVYCRSQEEHEQIHPDEVVLPALLGRQLRPQVVSSEGHLGSMDAIVVGVALVLQLHGSDKLEDFLLRRLAQLVQAAALPYRHEDSGQRLLVFPFEFEDVHATPLVDRHLLYALRDLRLPVAVALLLPPVPDDRVLHLHPGGDRLEAFYPPAAAGVHVQPRVGLAPLPHLPLLETLRGLELLLHPLERLLAPLDLWQRLLRIARALQDGAVLRDCHGGAGLERGHQVRQAVAGAVQVALRPRRHAVRHRVGHHPGDRSLWAVRGAAEARGALWRELHEALGRSLMVSNRVARHDSRVSVAHGQLPSQRLSNAASHEFNPNPRGLEQTT